MQNNQNANLQLVLCSVREPEQKYRDYYEKIYKCWNSVWEAAYTEAKYKKRSDDLKSDAFTRQDYVAAFFHENECVAFILFRHVDLSLQTTLDDSFFTQWSEIHRKALSKIGHKMVICGNLGIAPTFRHNLLGFSLRDLFGGLITEITLQANADATIATPRRDRNMHGAAYRWGAIPIAQDIPWGYGIQIDLIAFCKEHILQHRNHELQSLSDQLWQNKLIIGSDVFEPFKGFKNTQPYSLQNLEPKKKIG
ncbi:MAG: hypothetical protein NDI63_09640 [Pseudobdellovibrio sp.]|nr:hypothetical protein [Pseudobdellovibrio sp.]